MVVRKSDTLNKDDLVSIRTQLGYNKKGFADLVSLDENLYYEAERGTDKGDIVGKRVMDFCYCICQVPNITETSLKNSVFYNYQVAIREYIVSKLELVSLMGTKKYSKDSKEFLLTLRDYLDKRDRLVLLSMQFVNDDAVFGAQRSPNSIKEISSLLEELMTSSFSEIEDRDFWNSF